MISGDLNPGDNTFHCLIARDRGTLMGVLCSNFFFFKPGENQLYSLQNKAFHPYSVTCQKEGHSHLQISLGMKHINTIVTHCQYPGL